MKGCGCRRAADLPSSLVEEHIEVASQIRIVTRKGG
jgi:hypothetical protein